MRKSVFVTFDELMMGATPKNAQPGIIERNSDNTIRGQWFYINTKRG